MKKPNSLQSWIDTGYYQFSKEGLEGIQVERLARILNLNKSGYYHYFGDQSRFLDMVLKYHSVMAALMANEMRSMKQFDPEFITILLNYKTTVMFHMQLVRNRHYPLLNECYIKINAVVEKAVIPSWAEFIETPDNSDFALKYFELFRDMFYSRITSETMNPEFLRNIIYDSRELVQQLIQLKPEPIPVSR